MGRQVNFYMTHEDENAFIEMVRTKSDVYVFKSVQKSENIVDLLEMPPNGENYWFAIVLWNRAISPTPILSYVEKTKQYTVDESRSEVIQFSRCGFNRGRLTSGRIWAEMNLFNSDGTFKAKKSDDFIKWYERIARLIKKNSTRRADGNYIFPGAAKYFEDLRAS